MADAINVTFEDETLSLSPALVRSWCRCSMCGDTTAGLRWVSPAEIPLDIVAHDVDQAGSTLNITWSDGHRSQIDLTSIAAPEHSGSTEPSLPMSVPKPVDYAAVVESDDALLAVLEALAVRGIALINNAPRTDDATVTLAERFGPIRVTSYGKVQVFITSPDAKTAAHTGNAQHPHTDEPFRYCPPGFLFFHSMQSAAEGHGTSLLVDGFAAAGELRRQDPEAFHRLATTRVEFHREHTDEVRFSTKSQILTVADDGGVEAVRLNNRCLAPLDPLADDAEALLRAIAAFSAISENPDNQLRLHLQAGDILVFDNHRVMHGRTGFADDQPRHLRSCNVDRDEVHSRHRTLAHRAGALTPRLATGPTT